MNQIAMIVKAASESLTNFSTRKPAVRYASENAPEQTDTDSVFRKSTSELLKHLLVINRDSCDSDVNETNASETAKKRKNNAGDSFERARKIVTHGEDSVTNEVKQNSFCNNFYDDKPSLEMGVFSVSCAIAKCGVDSVWQPVPEVNHGSMDDRCGDVCETSENEEKSQSSRLSDEVQSFREILQRTISSEESTRTEQFSDDDLSLLPEVLPETLSLILAETEKNLNIESPDSGPIIDSSSECSEFADLVPFSGSFSRSASQFSPGASTSKDFAPVEPTLSIEIVKKSKNQKGENGDEDVEDDEMVLVPYGEFLKIFFAYNNRPYSQDPILLRYYYVY